VIEAIRFLGDHDAIHHFHAKDTKVYDANAREGRTRHDELHRRERSLVAVPFDRLRPRREPLEGRRLDARMVGYEGALSIEHEDSLTSSREG